MNNVADKMMKLTLEVVNLIKEVKQNAEFIEDNNIISDVQTKETGDIILKCNNGKEIEYSLSEVSYILLDDVYGIWKNELDFFEMLKNEEKHIEEICVDLSKEGAKDYLGNFYYLKFRAQNILNRLREIEKQA